MKKLAFILLVLFWCSFLTGQNIVVNNTDLGGVNIPFQDTTIYTMSSETGMCTSKNVYFDLDQDTLPDIGLYLYCYLSGHISEFTMSLSVFNDFWIHQDTTYQEHAQYVENYSVHDTVRTVSVVKRYHAGDTIFPNESTTKSTRYILNYSETYEPQCTWSNIDLFTGDTSYIAFSKDDGNTQSLYYIKIYMRGRSDIRLFWVKTNDHSIDMAENRFPSIPIFPNPVVDELHFRGGFNFVEIYSLQGLLVMKQKLTASQQAINVSNITKGLYIIRFRAKDTEVSSKFIKL